MRVQRRGVAATAAAIAVVAAAVASTPAVASPSGPPRVVDGSIGDWVGRSSSVAGSLQYDAGEAVYQDYVYDDAGAAATAQRPPQRGTFDGKTTGTYRYPTDSERYADNAADLLELRMATSTDTVYGLVRLNTYRDPSTTVAALAFDLDGDRTDTAGTWPRGAGLATPGADVVVTIWGSAGELTDLATGETVPVAVGASTDDADNAMEFSVDRALLPGSRWTLWAATGLWDGTGWMPVPGGAPTATSPGYGNAGLPRAFNVAFRSEESGGFYEDRQAAALAARDIVAFSATIDVATLDAGASVPYELETGRFVEVVVDQGFTIGPLHEGTSYSGGVPGRFGGVGGAALSQHFDYFGRHQPYSLRLPSDWDGSRPWPLLLALHGLGGSHAGWVTRPSFTDQVLEAPGHDSLVLVAPLGRGSSFYADYGERDVLEVLADVEARVAVDADRRYLVGYSMGGYGTYRLTTTRPDLWAAAAVYAGYTGEAVGDYPPSYEEIVGGDPGGLAATVREATGLGDGTAGQAATGNPVALVGNLREIPILHAAGSNDEVVPTTGQYRAAQELDELDYRHRFDLYPGFEHLSFALFDDWAGARDWLGDLRRVTAPREVTYRFSPAYADPNLGVDLGLRYDRAYWVSGLERRTGANDPAVDVLTYGRIHAESHALAGRSHDVVPVRSVATANHPHAQIGDAWVDTGPLPQSNALTVELENVRRAVIDGPAAGLRPDGLVVTITTDGPAALVVTGPFGSDDRVEIELPGPGTYRVATP